MNQQRYSKVIAIDGPSGSGKSTIAKKISKSLELTYLDTGAMFRALSVVLDRGNIKTEIGITKKIALLDFEYENKDKVFVSIDGEDLSEHIRKHEVSKLASFYSQFDAVRTYLADLQRDIAGNESSVLEGRDIGTVIFPNAAIKVFLSADAKVRAKRRFDQLVAKDPSNANKYSIESILKDIEDRDLSDSTREMAPLIKADDAIEIDTSSLSIDEVTSKIIEIYQTKKEMFTNDN